MERAHAAPAKRECALAEYGSWFVLSAGFDFVTGNSTFWGTHCLTHVCLYYLERAQADSGEAGVRLGGMTRVFCSVRGF